MELEDRYRQAQRPQYECILFDLDDTLYPLRSGIAAECLKNIRDYMVEKLRIDENKIEELCELYCPPAPARVDRRGPCRTRLGLTIQELYRCCSCNYWVSKCKYAMRRLSCSCNYWVSKCKYAMRRLSYDALYALII